MPPVISVICWRLQLQRLLEECAGAQARGQAVGFAVHSRMAHRRSGLSVRRAVARIERGGPGRAAVASIVAGPT